MSRTARWAVALSLSGHALLLLMPGPGGELRRLVAVHLLAGETPPLPALSQSAATLAADDPALDPSPPAPAPPAVESAAAPSAGVFEAGPRPDRVDAAIPPDPPGPRAAEREPGSGNPVTVDGPDQPAGGDERSPASGGRGEGGPAVGGACSSGGAAMEVPVGGTAPEARPGVLAKALPTSVNLLGLIRERIMSARDYPVLARRRGWEGTVKVRFRVGSGGRAEGVELVESSGIGVLDRASVKAVETGAPYPAYEGWIVVPIVFQLES